MPTVCRDVMNVALPNETAMACSCQRHILQLKLWAFRSIAVALGALLQRQMHVHNLLSQINQASLCFHKCMGVQSAGRI